MKAPTPLNSRLQFSLVFVVVFVSGYLVMALEVLSFRIIQPYFGNSIYSTGSVLGVVLTAMTVGYWLGGSLSSRFKPTKIQTAGFLIAGLWIISLGGVPHSVPAFFKIIQQPDEVVEYLVKPPLRTVPEWVLSLPLGDSEEIRMRTDPLIASTILFFIPCLLLAMISPCAVAELTHKASDAGKKSGHVYAIGSLGSITGVVLTSFWLIAVMGTIANVRLIGVTAVAIAILANII
jgi:hypothetical protein